MQVPRALIAAGAFALAACGNSTIPDSEQAPPVGLTAFTNCNEIETYLRLRALDEPSFPIGFENTTRGLETRPYGYTTTNVQVPGVDEPDLVKTDGKHIYVLSGNSLFVVESWPAARMRLRSAIDVYGDPREMLLDGDGHLIVFSDVANTERGPLTKVVVFETGGPYLRAVRSYWLFGSYRGARLVGHSLRIASYSSYRGATTLDDWLPDRTAESLKCTDVYRSSAPLRLGLTTIATVNLYDPWIQRTLIIGEMDEIYASKNAFYLAGGTREWTHLHKFAFTDPYRARYAGSSALSGRLLDSFSMDEYGAALRVVTTDQSGSLLSVLAEEDGTLARIGQLALPANGEIVTGVRFLRGRAFIAMSGDQPLFAIDLRIPEDPTIAGTAPVLRSPTYLHPLGANHLLALGDRSPDGEDLTNVWGRGVQLELFDVTDLAKPKLADSIAVGTIFGSSEASYEHHAFDYFPRTQLLALPFQDWARRDGPDGLPFVSDLRVFNVDVGRGITKLGAIDMSDLCQTDPRVRRSVMADGYIYAITGAGIRVARATALDRPLATVSFRDEMTWRVDLEPWLIDIEPR